LISAEGRRRRRMGFQDTKKKDAMFCGGGIVSVFFISDVVCTNKIIKNNEYV
jgi:hypothetical protein